MRIRNILNVEADVVGEAKELSDLNDDVDQHDSEGVEHVEEQPDLHWFDILSDGQRRGD